MVTKPEVVARLLRDSARRSPLWIDVEGSSMGRGIVSGARVLIDPDARPRPGQVWACVDQDGDVFVHRVRAWRHGRVVLQGDGNPLPDPPVPSALLVGRVRLVEQAGVRFRPDRLRALRPLLRQWWGAARRSVARLTRPRRRS